MFGKQPEKMEGTDTWVWVMPSSSARCAQLPRAIDKVPFYEALKKFRDFVTGKSDEPHEEEIVFSQLNQLMHPGAVLLDSALSCDVFGEEVIQIYFSSADDDVNTKSSSFPPNFSPTPENGVTQLNTQASTGWPHTST